MSMICEEHHFTHFADIFLHCSCLFFTWPKNLAYFVCKQFEHKAIQKTVLVCECISINLTYIVKGVFFILSNVYLRLTVCVLDSFMRPLPCLLLNSLNKVTFIHILLCQDYT